MLMQPCSSTQTSWARSNNKHGDLQQREMRLCNVAAPVP
jgi:hypothetical protein